MTSRDLTRIESKVKQFKCQDCSYASGRIGNYNRHVTTIHLNSLLNSKCCGVSFKNKAERRQHRVQFHDSGYECDKCGRNFDRNSLLRRHYIVHTGEKSFKCEDCDYSTNYRWNLNRHFNTCHAKRIASSSSAFGIVVSPSLNSTPTSTSKQISTKSEKASTQDSLTNSEKPRLKVPPKYFPPKSNVQRVFQHQQQQIIVVSGCGSRVRKISPLNFISSSQTPSGLDKSFDFGCFHNPCRSRNFPEQFWLSALGAIYRSNCN